MTDREMKKFNGAAILVAMFREFDPQTRVKFGAKIKEQSPILARLIEQCEFIYADLYWLDNRSLQKLLTVIPENDWQLAWKLTDDRTKKRLLENMSSRRQEQFLETMDLASKVHKSQVYRVQAVIAQSCHSELKLGRYKMHSRRAIIGNKE
jgi:flagellar motor switch protein FliG